MARNLWLTCAVVRARDLFPRPGWFVQPRRPRRHGADDDDAVSKAPRAVSSARRSPHVRIRRAIAGAGAGAAFFHEPPPVEWSIGRAATEHLSKWGSAGPGLWRAAGGRDPRQGGVGNSFKCVGLAGEREGSRLLRGLEFLGWSGGWEPSLRTCRRDSEKSGKPWSRKRRRPQCSW